MAKQAKPADEPQAESVAGYFRKVFQENPKARDIQSTFLAAPLLADPRGAGATDS